MTSSGLRLVAEPAGASAPPGAYTPDLAAIRADVEALAAMRRDSAGAGERTAAGWVASRLARAGAAEAHVQPYRGRATYGWSFAGHAAAGLAATARGGPLGAAAALAALCSLERDASGRAPWRRRGLGGDRGANAAARVPARGERRATVVLVAHLDAAHTGLAWHPAVTRARARSRLRRHSVDPFLAPVAAALLAGGAAGLSGSRRARRVRAGAAGILALAAALNLDIARSATVPGANDNATGVAVLLDLVRALAAEPLEHVEVLAVCSGGEESGMGGFAAFLRARAGSLHAASTFVVGLDTLGSGTPIVAAAEGSVATHRYREADLAPADEGAALAGLPAPERWRLGGWTDPVLARHAGLPALSLLSMGPGYFPGYHHPTDVPDGVDFDCVGRCARIAAGTVHALARRAALTTGPAGAAR
jgi:peptidase M28-like protein